MLVAERDGVTLYGGNALDCYASWPSPTLIISDGPYGLGMFPGEPDDPADLASWYEPHARAWSAAATMSTTLFLWSTEIGWALTHPVLDATGWDYLGLNVWDKTLAHLAGNVSTATLRRFPPVTEVCAQYVRRGPADLPGSTVQGWLRQEWARSGLPWRDANTACGVAEAASRKWLTPDQWYWPPPAMFELLAEYANEHGDPAGAPYFDLDAFGHLGGPSHDEAGRPIGLAERWCRLRPRFACPFGVTNVWSVPAVRGAERLRHPDGSAAHPNQKPLVLMERLVASSTVPGEVVWEPFAGTATGLVAAWRLGRLGCGAEVDRAWSTCGAERLLAEPLSLFGSEPSRSSQPCSPLALFTEEVA